MITALLLACYLPVAALPALISFNRIRRVEPVYPGLAFAPVAMAVLSIAMARGLTELFGHAVALIPVAISFLSLAIAMAGLRLWIHAGRVGGAVRGIALRTTLAAIPFLALSPFLILGVGQAMFAR